MSSNSGGWRLALLASKEILGFDPQQPYFKLEVPIDATSVPAGSPKVDLGKIPGDSPPPHTLEPVHPTNDENCEKAFDKGREALGDDALNRGERIIDLEKRNIVKGIKADTGINFDKWPVWPFYVAGGAAVATAVIYCHENPEKCD